MPRGAPPRAGTAGAKGRETEKTSKAGTETEDTLGSHVTRVRAKHRVRARRVAGGRIASRITRWIRLLIASPLAARSHSSFEDGAKRPAAIKRARRALVREIKRGSIRPPSEKWLTRRRNACQNPLRRANSIRCASAHSTAHARSTIYTHARCSSARSARTTLKTRMTFASCVSRATGHIGKATCSA